MIERIKIRMSPEENKDFSGKVITLLRREIEKIKDRMSRVSPERDKREIEEMERREVQLEMIFNARQELSSDTVEELREKLEEKITEYQFLKDEGKEEDFFYFREKASGEDYSIDYLISATEELKGMLERTEIEE